MITLLNHLYESLLDDEDILVDDDKDIIDKSLKDFQDFFTNYKRNKHIEVSKTFVLDNQLKKGGICKIIPVEGFPERIDLLNAIKDKRKIKYADKKHGIYSGNYEIHGPIPDWPVQLEIGNPRNLTIYSKEQITQNMIPDMCLSLDIVHLSAVGGLEFTCRFAHIMSFEKINKPVTITIYSDPKYRADVIDISNTENYIKHWSDLNCIISNCKYISIMRGDFVEDIINKYDDENTQSHYEVEINEPELTRLQQTNFKNIETIYLYAGNDNYYYLTYYKGKWEFHSNKTK